MGFEFGFALLLSLTALVSKELRVGHCKVWFPLSIHRESHLAAGYLRMEFRFSWDQYLGVVHLVVMFQTLIPVGITQRVSEDREEEESKDPAQGCPNT